MYVIHCVWLKSNSRRTRLRGKPRFSAAADVLLVVVTAVVQGWRVRVTARLPEVVALPGQLVVVDSGARLFVSTPRVARQLVHWLEEGVASRWVLKRVLQYET